MIYHFTDKSRRNLFHHFFFARYKTVPFVLHILLGVVWLRPLKCDVGEVAWLRKAKLATLSFFSPLKTCNTQKNRTAGMLTRTRGSRMRTSRRTITHVNVTSRVASMNRQSRRVLGMVRMTATCWPGCAGGLPWRIEQVKVIVSHVQMKAPGETSDRPQNRKPRMGQTGENSCVRQDMIDEFLTFSHKSPSADKCPANQCHPSYSSPCLFQTPLQMNLEKHFKI